MLVPPVQEISDLILQTPRKTKGQTLKTKVVKIINYTKNLTENSSIMKSKHIHQE